MLNYYYADDVIDETTKSGCGPFNIKHTAFNLRGGQEKSSNVWI